MDKKEILEDRKQAFDKLEKQLQENVPAEDRFFYYHSSEDRIVKIVFSIIIPVRIASCSRMPCFGS